MIQKVFKDTTVITIAHRLETIIDYDTILVLKNGELVEKGSAKELYALGGIFTNLVVQNSGNLKDKLVDW